MGSDQSKSNMASSDTTITTEAIKSPPVDDQIIRKDFGLLPDVAFQSILGYLPLEDRVRCKRVNHNWRRQCDQSICTKSSEIDFTNPKMFKIPEDQLKALLKKCNKHLVAAVFDVPETVRWHSRHRWSDRGTKSAAAAALFSQFSYPKLQRLKFDCKFFLDPPRNQQAERFANVIALINQCPSLRCLHMSWIVEDELEISQCTNISSNLQTLRLDNIYKASTKSVIWMTKKCNNLTDLKFSLSIPESEPAKSDFLTAMRALFQACRELTHVDVRNFGSAIDDASQLMLKNVWSFWSLPKLITLKLNQVDDQDLAQMVKSFPLLETLHVDGCDGLTNIGVRSLAHLRELNDLTIIKAENSISAGVAAIAANGKLTKFYADVCNLGDLCCVLLIIQCCQQIRELQIPLLRNLPSVEMVVVLIQAIKTYLRPGGQLHIYLPLKRYHVDDVWVHPVIQKAALALHHLGSSRKITGCIGGSSF